MTRGVPAAVEVDDVLGVTIGLRAGGQSQGAYVSSARAKAVSGTDDSIGVES